MTIKLISQREFVDAKFHGIELIHTRPFIVLSQGVRCAHCFVDIAPGLTHYKYEGAEYCVSCTHYHHERAQLNCGVCFPNIEFKTEGNMENSEIMITPDGRIVISDDVVADIDMMRKVEE